MSWDCFQFTSNMKWTISSFASAAGVTEGPFKTLIQDVSNSVFASSIFFFFPLWGFASGVGFLPMSLLSSSDEKDAFIWKLSLSIESVSRLFVVFITNFKNWSLSQNINWFTCKSSVLCLLLLNFTLFSSLPNCPCKAFYFDLISMIWTSNSLTIAASALPFTSHFW